MTESPEQLHIQFQHVFNRHDLDSIVALYEPGAVLARPGGPVEGADAIREAYRSVLDTHPAIELRTLAVYRAGDRAMLHGKWVLHETGPDGARIRREGRNAETVRRQPDGRWLFAIDNPHVPWGDGPLPASEEMARDVAGCGSLAGEVFALAKFRDRKV